MLMAQAGQHLNEEAVVLGHRFDEHWILRKRTNPRLMRTL